ncbi:MAG: extracellular solute-binding protein [Thermotogae bacterium]|nr:extracellular solute-binding protein [Thermotogota bacterium]
MKGWKRALLVLVLFLVWGSLVLAVENITLRAYVIGPGPMGIKKATNLELAAQRLNQMLEAIGSEIRVQVDVNFSELKWSPFADKFYLDFAAGKAPDIVTLRETAELAKGGFIVPMDEHVEQFWAMNYFDFYPNLWEGATWNGKIWGIPHDISPTGVWYRRDVLRKLGYSDEEIDRLLPPDGDTTLETLARLAQEAVKAGLVEYGILHRPSKGPGIYNMLLAFGAECYDPSADTLVFNESALLNFYRWHKSMVEAGVIPPEPPSWSTIHSTFVAGKTFATLASHIGTPAEWKAKYGLTDESLYHDLGFMPFPPTENAKKRGVKPSSVHDFPLYFVTSQSKHPELAKLLIMFATSSEACAIHSRYTLRPPYRRSAMYLLSDVEYIQKTAASVESVRPVPVHPKFWDYMDRVFEALKGVEAGVVNPEQAVEDLKMWFLAEVENGRLL